ncbi:type I pantothenate kinase [Polymorphobacter fuscus]|uniref:Type I pantothenate kinase n=1 Tax=Sandarakinorhabdus fusca TaxID=1439888 RepID=A0A7C9KP93_9SPHN|nr:type I pantothenate kinase [Polymorphobacter fuscus]KAB7644422.1 type I pantothenate kinase [Polymorphobacter fuscus]MQT18344.1 type I pantothenate kinase [Polymorphobacter fuscus]NJC08244.1 type I pantothenate kinase [Polymorphobacter fuscus]
MPPIPIDTAGLSALLLRRAGHPPVIGITGSVAAGKSTLAGDLAVAMAGSRRVAAISTDGFLFPNAVLEARGLLLRKGFPESYDEGAMAHALAALRTGVAEIPVHSHVSYDIDPALTRRVGPADLVLIEGLGLSGAGIRPALDTLVYLDADVADIERWYVARFLRLWRAGASDPASFYHRFAALPEAQAEALARHTWATINLPNLTDHIAAARDTADILLRKDADHRLLLVRH